MAFKMGLFGAGVWARVIARLLAARGDVHIAAILVRDKTKPRDGLPDAPIYDDIKALLAAQALDGAIIATPSRTHAPLAVATLKAGVPCFLEKPAALSSADMAAIAAAAEMGNAPLVVDYLHLHNASFQRLRAEVQKRGRPLRISAVAGNPTPAPRDCSVLWDWGPHDIAMAHACLGSGHVSVAGARIQPQPEDFDSIWVDLNWSGVPVDLHFSQRMPDKTRRFSVHYAGETLEYADRPIPAVRLSTASHTDPKMLYQGEDNPLGTALTGFIEIAQARRADRAGLSLSMDVTRILEMIERKIKQVPA